MNPDKQIKKLPAIPASSVPIPNLPVIPGIAGTLSTLIVEAKNQSRSFIKNNVKEGTTNIDAVNSYADKLEANLLAQGINQQGKLATINELVFVSPPSGGLVTVTPKTT